MGALQWISEHWFDAIQVLGVVGGLFFTAHAIHRDERARQIANLIAINGQYADLWRELYDRPELARVLQKDLDLHQKPVTEAELLFVKMLLVHLDTVRRASASGIFVKIERLKDDVRYFISLPIPKAVWMKIKPFQDQALVTFVESAWG